MSDNYKDIIKIPESLDNAILKGVESGKRRKKNNNKIKIAKRIAMVASIFIVSISLIAVINPKLVSAIPIVSSIFEYINSNHSGESVDKYENLLDSVNMNIEKNGVKITLDKSAIDDNILVATFYVESDKLGECSFIMPPYYLGNDTGWFIYNGITYYETKFPKNIPLSKQHEFFNVVYIKDGQVHKACEAVFDKKVKVIKEQAIAQ